MRMRLRKPYPRLARMPSWRTRLHWRKKQRRARSPDEDPRKTYQRIAAMLARRGFRWDITKEALAQVLQAD